MANAGQKQWNAAKDFIACNTREGSVEERAQCEFVAAVLVSGAAPDVVVQLVQQHRRAIGANVCVAPC